MSAPPWQATVVIELTWLYSRYDLYASAAHTNDAHALVCKIQILRISRCMHQRSLELFQRGYVWPFPGVENACAIDEKIGRVLECFAI